jgi:uncharacterized SAM-binding protein YcdF (DUF218 family)
MTRTQRLWMALLTLFGLAGAACFLILSHLGQWLMVNEPLRHAQAIAVLGGGQGWRSIEAAGLYHAGWAPEIWLTQGTQNETDDELAGIGFPADSEKDFSRKVLLKLGVPDAAIRDIPQPVDNTVSELRAIAGFAQPQAGPVILVTSKSHTRRVRVIWDAVVRNPPAVIRYKPSDPFDPSRWWRTTTDALASFREAFGILNVWAGLPIAPRER